MISSTYLWALTVQLQIFSLIHYFIKVITEYSIPVHVITLASIITSCTITSPKEFNEQSIGRMLHYIFFLNNMKTHNFNYDQTIYTISLFCSNQVQRHTIFTQIIYSFCIYNTMWNLILNIQTYCTFSTINIHTAILYYIVSTEHKMTLKEPLKKLYDQMLGN